jgi:hypothetical protein
MTSMKHTVRQVDPHVRAVLRELESMWNEIVASVERHEGAPIMSPPERPQSWVELSELENQTDVWPGPDGGKDVVHFERFRRFEREDGLLIGLGHHRRDDGLVEIGVFLLSPGGKKKRLVVYFQPTEGFASTEIMFAPIRGKGGGRSYFRSPDALPGRYASMDTVTLGDVAPAHRLRAITVVLARADDWQTMVEHAATQVAIRNLTV